MPQINIADIHSLNNFKNILVVKRGQIDLEIRQLITNFKDIEQKWNDSQKRMVRQEFDKTLLILTRYIKSLDEFIEYLNNVLMAAKRYLDQ